MQALQRWDRAPGFVPAISEHPLADLYVCWDRQNLYLGIYAHDIVEEAYYRDRIVPKADRMQWIVQPAGATTAVRVRLGSGREPLVSDSSVPVGNLSGTGLLVRNISAMKLPAVLFGRNHFTAGETIEFACTLLTHCQADRMEWNGRFTLR